MSRAVHGAKLMSQQLFSIATMITMIVQVDTGLGRHVWTIGKHEAMLNLRAVSTYALRRKEITDID